MFYCKALLCALAFHGLVTEASGQVAWESLFDGKSLDGWVKRGGKATYRVEDGAIVGTTVPRTPNTFLCTERTFGDFILELEYKVSPQLNSGIQIRSNVKPNGRVFGYQVEIDPSKRAWSAGIYDEARRGWLHDLKQNPEARAAFKQDDWNHVRIVCYGARLQTWLNGVPAADLLDSMTLEGFIALQVHGVGKREDPLEVRWRNIRVQDLGRHEWHSIMPGEDLSGWHATPGGSWALEDGVLVGRSEKKDKRHGVLLTDQRYHDFTARVSYKAHQGNSGLYFRVSKVKGAVGVHGFQAEIDPERETGKLYETGGRANVAKPNPKMLEKALKKNDWNELTVTAIGRRVAVALNGRRTVELHDDPGRLSGHLGVQLHGSQDMHVEFRSIDVLRRVMAQKVPGTGASGYAFERRIYLHTDAESRGQPRAYRVLEPENPKPGQRYPLIFFLHGAGERGTDNAKQLTHFPEFMAQEAQRKVFPCFVIAPQCRPGKRWVETDWSKSTGEPMQPPRSEMQVAIAILRRALTELPIDQDRVYLTGLSMGGYGTWDLAARFPELFAAAAPICGGGDPKECRAPHAAARVGLSQRR